jgi:hypothetical protein
LGLAGKLTWAELYSEAELCKSAIRLYTKPLFSWRKALQSSTDGKNLYDFARHGLQNLGALHQKLSSEAFHFRPGKELRYNFNGKLRVIYLYPWEERLVDLLLYRMLSRTLQSWFSPNSYAYRSRGFGVDLCQRRVAQLLRQTAKPLFIVKRDVANYFPSIDHDILLHQLAQFVGKDDYLFRLLEERVRFPFSDGTGERTATRGIPFGTAIACMFANVHLTSLDYQLASDPMISYFRYADDLLILSASRDSAVAGAAMVAEHLAALRLSSKPSHELNFVFSESPVQDDSFAWTFRFRHLGLEFRANGLTGLSRDKLRKVCNLFRFALRRSRGKFRRIQDPEKRAKLAIQVIRKTIEDGIRNVAILDYYLKHVEDERQLVQLDRWLAEAVFSYAFENGHKKINFRKLSFAQLRAMGLPSLVHRRRLIRHGRVASPFFIWKGYQQAKSSRGAAARPRAVPSCTGDAAFSPLPEAAAVKTS